MILNRSIHIGEQAKRRVSACVKNFYMQRWGYCTRITTGELIYSMKNFPIKLERVQSITLSCSYSVTVLQKVRAEATGHIGMGLFFNKVGNSSINHTWAVDTRSQLYKKWELKQLVILGWVYFSIKSETVQSITLEL